MREEKQQSAIKSLDKNRLKETAWPLFLYNKTKRESGSNRQEGEGGGLCRSVPVAHQSGRSSLLNVSGGNCDLFVQGLRVF